MSKKEDQSTLPDVSETLREMGVRNVGANDDAVPFIASMPIQRSFGERVRKVWPHVDRIMNTKRWVHGAALALLLAAGSPFIYPKYRLWQKQGLDEKANDMAEALKVQAEVYGTLEQVKNDIDRCTNDSNRCDQAVQNGGDGILQNFFTKPTNYVRCSEEKVSCLSAVHPEK